jgi:hypothetical protein
MFGLLKKPEAKIDVKAEILRRKSQSARILDLLKQGGEITNVDLQRIAFNYTMRISELRKEGHVIVSTYEKPGVWSYTYLGSKDEE